MSNVLEVRGSGKKLVIPAKLSLQIDIVSVEEKYNAAYGNALKRYQKLKDTNLDIVTDDFKVDQLVRYYDDVPRIEKYQVTIKSKLEIKARELSATLNLITKEEISPLIAVSPVSDHTYRQELIELAIQDAKEQAQIIAQTLKLSNLTLIGVDYRSNTPIRPMAFAQSSIALSPYETTLEETVTLRYLI